jgi:hypothetical protein
MIHRSLISLSFLCLAACGGQTTPPTEPSEIQDTPAAPITAEQQTDITPEPAISQLPSIGPKAQTKRKAEIDWASAREDLAANGDNSVQIQSAGEEPANVPVLLPTGIVTSQSAGNGPVFRRTSDGYFAFYPGDTYNIIVNGTNEVVAADAIKTTNPERAAVFSTTVAGAQVWLSRYGADYTVEFECNTLENEDSTCIEEEAAMEIARNLIVSGSK